MADESGSGSGGRDRGEGSDAPDFSGFSSDWGDVTSELEAEIDRVNRENALADLVADRLGERPGRFSITAQDIVYPEQRGWGTRLRDFLYGRAKTYATNQTISFANQFVPSSVLKVPLALAQLGFSKYNRASDQELENQAGRLVGDYMTGGALTGISMLGRGLEWAGEKAGLPNRPEGQPTIGEQPAGPGQGVADIADAVNFDRGQFARQPRYSDGSFVDDREPHRQLLQRAKSGRA